MIQDADTPFSGSLHKPVNWFWILITFVFSYLFTLITSSLDKVWLPDPLALTIVYWTIRYPRHIGMSLAFVCGIIMDVNNGSVLGQQALGYVILAYLAFSFHRRIPWFGMVGQALHITPLLLLSQMSVIFVRLWLDGVWPDTLWFLQSLSGGIIWPAICFILSLPEHRRSSDS